MDSNHRPRAYQARALTTWAMRHYGYFIAVPLMYLWWRWWESNPWPPACRAGALPAELHPHRFGYHFFLLVTFRSLKIEQQVDLCFLLSTALLHSSSFPLWFLFCLFANTRYLWVISHILHRKEVIQPHLPIRLPCYDLTPINKPTFDCCPLAVSPQASGVFIFHGLTGGVYKARERIHRGMLIRDY